ncbi:MAG: DUF4388 domain-containing protein [Verrucomicrobiota bacterium]
MIALKSPQELLDPEKIDGVEKLSSETFILFEVRNEMYACSLANFDTVLRFEDLKIKTEPKIQDRAFSGFAITEASCFPIFSLAQWFGESGNASEQKPSSGVLVSEGKFGVIVDKCSAVVNLPSTSQQFPKFDRLIDSRVQPFKRAVIQGSSIILEMGFSNEMFVTEQILNAQKSLFASLHGNKEEATAAEIRKTAETKNSPNRISLEGDLRPELIFEIIQLLCQEQRSGILNLKDPGKLLKGNIVFSEGKILNATIDDADGIQAFHRLCMAQAGSFQFFEQEARGMDRIIHEGPETLIQKAIEQLK